jgi:phospholipid-binding lipoprotein MlaA
MDVAADMNVRRDERGFGQTLGSWGMPMGGFFVLPLFAQTNTRDLSGDIADGVFDPSHLLVGAPIVLVLDLSLAFIDVYDGYDFIISTDESAIDSYATFKTMYLQNRDKKIEDVHPVFRGAETGAQKAPAYDFDME